MVDAAEREGALGPGDTIVEPTSGNTGIGLAMVGAAKGYDVLLIIPESKSPERRQIMRAYGAEVELIDGDISAARARADELDERDAYVQMRQFENPANPRSHYRTTGEEIVKQVGDRTVDALVAGVGTGGAVAALASSAVPSFVGGMLSIIVFMLGCLMLVLACAFDVEANEDLHRTVEPVDVVGAETDGRSPDGKPLQFVAEEGAVDRSAVETARFDD